MRTRGDRGAAAPEYIAILLIAAMFTSAVAVGVKPEWVQQKVCQPWRLSSGRVRVLRRARRSRRPSSCLSAA